MKKENSLVAILEHPSYISNIGSIIRTINALGVDALFVVDKHKRLEDNIESIHKRKSLLKHSNGAVKHTKIIVFHSSEQCLDHLNEKDFISLGTTPHDLASIPKKLAESELRDKKLAIWFGNESKGLSKEVISKCKFCITIPMIGVVESLNLSTTVGIVLYEATKQRR